MDHRVLVPVPVRQSKLWIAAYLLKNLFEKEEVCAMPVEEMIRAVFAESETCRVAVDQRLGLPTDGSIQAFHGLNGVAIRIDVGIDFG